MSSELVAALAGAAVAFVFGIADRWVRDFRQSRKTRNSVRLLLRLEIDNNLSLLHQYWAGIQLDPEHDDGQKVQQAVRRFARDALPAWSHRAWESQMSAIPDALTEDEIRQVAGLHKLYASLVQQQQSARETRKSDDVARATRAEHDIMAGTELLMAAQDIWKGCRDTTRKLLALGNPLTKPKSRKHRWPWGRS